VLAGSQQSHQAQEGNALLFSSEAPAAIDGIRSSCKHKQKKFVKMVQRVWFMTSCHQSFREKLNATDFSVFV